MGMRLAVLLSITMVSCTPLLSSPVDPVEDFVVANNRFVTFSCLENWLGSDHELAAGQSKFYSVSMPKDTFSLAHARYVVAEKIWNDMPDDHDVWTGADGIKWGPLKMVVALLRAAHYDGERAATEKLVTLCQVGLTDEAMPSDEEASQMKDMLAVYV